MPAEGENPPPERRKADPEPVVESGDEPVDAVSSPASAPTPSPEPAESWESRFRYLFADFENYRRRMDRERGRVVREGQARLLNQLLPLYEAAQRAREAVSHASARDPVRQGIDLLVREWEKFLRSEHVESVARPGSQFRSETMEAVAEAPPSTAHPSGSVVEVVQQGYLLDEELLRPAKVVVARRVASPAPAQAEPSASSSSEEPSGR